MVEKALEIVNTSIPIITFPLNNLNLDKSLTHSRSQFSKLENKDVELDLNRSF